MLTTIGFMLVLNIGPLLSAILVTVTSLNIISRTGKLAVAMASYQNCLDQLCLIILSFFICSIMVCIYVVDDNFISINTMFFYEIWSIKTAECDRKLL